MEKRIKLSGIDPMAFYGARDVNLRFLEDYLNAEVIARGNEMLVRGSEKDVQEADKVIGELLLLVNRNGSISPDDVETAEPVVRLAAALRDGTGPGGCGAV
ncbi:MAG: hypothetical protein U5R06_10260 [candidate division KSB1 bacterium]|nr:hypothetical protein [candidate division KSB1 bacterium]